MHAMTKRRFAYFSGFILLIAILFILSIYLAGYIAESDVAQEIVGRFGYFGIILLGIVGGFNLLVPVPAATFTPIFVASGFSTFGIIAGLAIGTTVADLISYYVGAIGKHYSGFPESPLYEKIHTIREKHSKLLVPFIFLYASFAPYPNEAMIVPLAFMGMRMRTFILPVLIGNTTYNTVLVLGISGIIEFLKF